LAQGLEQLRSGRLEWEMPDWQRRQRPRTLCANDPWPARCGESCSYSLPLRPTRLADGLGLGSRPTTQTRWIRPAERLHQANTLSWVPRIRLPGDPDLGRFLLCPATQGLTGGTIETATIIVLPGRVSNRPDFLGISLLSSLDC